MLGFLQGRPGKGMRARQRKLQQGKPPRKQHPRSNLRFVEFPPSDSSIIAPVQVHLDDATTEVVEWDTQIADDIRESSEVFVESDALIATELERKTWERQDVLHEFVFQTDKVNDYMWQVNKVLDECAALADEDLKELQDLIFALDIGLAR